MRDECEHGSLRRKCEVCSLCADLAAAQAEVEKYKNLANTAANYKADNERLRGLCCEAAGAIESALWNNRVWPSALLGRLLAAGRGEKT